MAQATTLNTISRYRQRKTGEGWGRAEAFIGGYQEKHSKQSSGRLLLFSEFHLCLLLLKNKQLKIIHIPSPWLWSTGHRRRPRYKLGSVDTGAVLEALRALWARARCGRGEGLQDTVLQEWKVCSEGPGLCKHRVRGTGSKGEEQKGSSIWEVMSCKHDWLTL